MSNRRYILTPKNSGFTLVEMLIVAPIVIGIIGIFITVVITMTGDILTARGSNGLAYSIQDTLARIEQDARMSGAYLATNNIPLVSPQGYNNDTTAFHNATTDTTVGPMLIFNSYTTTSNPSSSTRKIIYKTLPNTCGSNSENKNSPLTINIVYFVKNNTLWRRTITKSTYTTDGCSLPWQQPSCAPGVVNSFCKTQDIRLVDGVSPNGGFNITYYTSINPDVVNTEATNVSAGKTDATRLTGLQASKVAKVTINATSSVAGRDIARSGSVLITSSNNYTAN